MVDVFMGAALSYCSGISETWGEVLFRRCLMVFNISIDGMGHLLSIIVCSEVLNTMMFWVLH